jgi:hypothetical protein
MSMRTTFTTLAAVGALSGWALASPAPASAHCDSMDGPVVKAARAALEQQNVALVLGWVRLHDEPEIRAAFRRTLEARRAGGEARAVADRWFYETVVRVHRAGEGAPYTGLKPAGYGPAEGIVAADRALEEGRGGLLAAHVAEQVAQAVRERYERVHALVDHDPADVEATRAWVHAYVEYIHLVEHILEATGHGEGEGS